MVAMSTQPATDVTLVFQAARERFVLDPEGIHGPSHWQRVRENGLRVAKYSKADRLIVELFAFLHDCCREDDSHDPEHGERAAAFAESLRGTLIHLDDPDFTQLYLAIRNHSFGFTRGTATVLTCWDADRLDLGRVGSRPDPRYLCTEFAKREGTIKWAYRRSLDG
jgi:uncharacterized protein